MYEIIYNLQKLTKSTGGDKAKKIEIEVFRIDS